MLKYARYRPHDEIDLDKRDHMSKVDRVYHTLVNSSPASARHRQQELLSVGGITGAHFSTSEVGMLGVPAQTGALDGKQTNMLDAVVQILDDGHVTDSLGRKINFKNTLIILTSNLGVKKLQDFGTGIGFSNNTYSNEEAKKEVLMKEMKNFFSPEFINRIDDTIVFNSLSQEDIKKITDIELKKLMKRLEEMKYKISYDESLLDYLSKIGYDEVYGARPLKRAIQDKVEDLLSEEVLTDKIIPGKTYVIKVENEEVKVIKKGR